MHPILASRRYLALYLMAWLPVVAVLTAAMVMTGWETWAQSLVFSFAMTVVYAFLCLAAWYPCRAMPLDDQHVVTALFTHFTAAVASGMLWVGPESAGANPGPVCYDQGGQQVTVTDASVVLGRTCSSLSSTNE